MSFLTRVVLLMLAIASAGVLAAGPTTQANGGRTKDHTKIVLCGDSTVTDNAGWALGFKKHLAANVDLVNLSKGGRSSGSFAAEGKWAQALAMKPDYVLIQFGHNDQPGHGDRESDPATTYREHLLRYVDEAQAAGVTPVLLTPLSRRQWNRDGTKIESTLEPYAEAVRKIASEKHVPLVDLHARSIAFYEKLGKDAMLELSPLKNADAKQKNSDTASTQNNGHDGTHLNEKGSDAIGAIVAESLGEAVAALADSINDAAQ